LQRRYDEAQNLFSDLPAAHDNNSKIILEKILVHYGVNENTKAEALFAPLLTDKPELRNRYTFLADELFKMTNYTLSDEYFEKAIAIRSNKTAHYNRACAYALIGNKDKSFELLNIAIEKGYDSKTDFENDADLASLKSDARWKQLVEKLK
jgi:tetratricopeptide (TPR) repeat protein